MKQKIKNCRCGKEVRLTSSWANTCKSCKTEYNGAGQRLAPREQWGEETGEVFLDGEPDPDIEQLNQRN